MSLIRGNALTIPLADNSVDLIVTSPPYFALRSYTDACGTCGGAPERPPLPKMTSSTLGGGAYVIGRGSVAKEQPAAEPDPDCPECEGSGRGHYAGQLGSEATPAAFIDALVSVTRECVRVLKPSGSLFVNLGDKYANPTAPGERTTLPQGGRPGQLPSVNHKSAKQTRRIPTPMGGMRAKSLMGLPWRYALACIDDLGLILRAEIIWSKPNGLPESVQDRVRRSHEQWFHFTKEPRYYSAVDEIREAHKYPLTAEGMASRLVGGSNSIIHGSNRGSSRDNGASVNTADDVADATGSNPLGKLPGSVWTIPTEPLRVPDDLPQHFAAFPSEWPRRIILGWSPSGICTACGEGRRPVSEAASPGWDLAWREPQGQRRDGTNGLGGSTLGTPAVARDRSITGESCACPTPTAPTRPAVVLDPFAGTGTSVAVANHLGRYGVGLDLSADYLRLARWRCNDPGLRAKVLGVDKPAAEVPGQEALF